MLKSQNLLPFDGEVFHYPGFFSKAESDVLFEGLVSQIPWKQEPIIIFGKEVMQPRLTAWYADQGVTYKYSGVTLQAQAWPDSVYEIKRRVEKETGFKFNSALLNFYRDQTDSMGWHRDNEKELGANPVVASVSFGASRDFKFKNYKDKDTKVSVTLAHGDLLMMQGKTQHEWMHAIAKSTRAIGPRINITFRLIKN